MAPPTGPANKSQKRKAAPSRPATQPAPDVGIPWVDLPIAELSRYRHAFFIDAPPAYSNLHNAAVLTTSAVGKLSPSAIKSMEQYTMDNSNSYGKDSSVSATSSEQLKMLRKDWMGKVSKREMALSVRRYFNGQGAHEVEGMAEFKYKLIEARGLRAPPRQRHRFGINMRKR